MTARVREAGAATSQSVGYRMPAEWEPHERTWMLWPERPDNWRDNARPAQAAWVELVRAITGFEPVTAGARPGSADAAREALRGISDATVVEIDNDDAWMRDTGPTFITRPEEPRLVAMDWEFNAWGGANGGLYADWSADDKVAARVAGVADVPVIRTDGFVLEGGSIHVDGEGTLLTTEECLLNPNRNPSMNRAGIEGMLKQHLGVSRVVWLPWGLVDDETDGHIDNFACFVRPGEVLLSWTDDEGDPNYGRCRAALAVLEDAGLAVHRIPIPGPLFATAEEAAGVVPMTGTVPRRAGDRLAASYVNFLICNGGVVAPSFGVAEDAQALAVLRGLFPDREVVMVPGRELVLGGGNIHCLTQQQPRV